MLQLNEIRFRSSPTVELKALGELAAEQREPFRALENDPDFAGLLVAKPPRQMNVQAVGRETARLLRSLTIPSFVDDPTNDVIELVLDGILEIEHHGAFLTGADAMPLLCPVAEDAGRDGATIRLSRDALLHAQDHQSSDPGVLSKELYLYNRIPLSPSHRTRFADARAILTHLGADRGSLRALLEREWGPMDTREDWLYWPSLENDDTNGASWKLYVSPRPERISEAFAAFVRVLSARPVPFKIGGTAAALLRPDKLIAYFATREELDAAAAELRRELAGCEAQGVPFTAGLDEAGLLSWGVDPPDSERPLPWMEHDSWRVWIVNRLAAALALAKTASTAAATPPWRFAIERVRRHGVDVDTWTPSSPLWSAS